MAAYQSLRKNAVARDGADRQAQLERIVKLFEAKQAWWNRDFPKGQRPMQVASKDESPTPAGRCGGRACGARRLACRASADPRPHPPPRRRV